MARVRILKSLVFSLSTTVRACALPCVTRPRPSRRDGGSSARSPATERHTQTYLGRDEFCWPVRNDRAMVDAACEFVKPNLVASEAALQCWQVSTS